MTVPDVKLRNAKPANKRYPISIGGSVYLDVMPTGKKFWRMRYRKPDTKKQAIYTIGEYPGVSQIDALSSAQDAKRLVKQGIDPVEQRRQQIADQQKEAEARRQEELKKALNTFEKAARDWHQHRLSKQNKWEPKTARKVMRALEIHAFDLIGDKPITDVSAADVLAVIDRMQEQGKTNVVRKVGRYVNAIFDYAVNRELADKNPASAISSEYTPYTEQHHPILKAVEIKKFFDDLNAVSGSETLKIAIEFTMRTLARTEEVRFSQWSEFDFENNLWIPAKQNRKNNKEHVYPLPVQAVELLNRLKAGHTGVNYLFVTNSPFSPMSENAMLNVLYRMKYKGRVDMHGMRGTGSTILNEAFGSLLVDKEFNAELIEKALSHGDSDKVRSAYDHSQHIESLRILLQYYSDFIDGLRAGHDVVLTAEGVKPKGEASQVIPIRQKQA